MYVSTRRRIVLAGLFSLLAASRAASGLDLDSIPSWTCDAAANVTGSVGVQSGAAPSIAWDGTAYGVAWTSFATGDWEVHFSRIAADGTLLVPATRITASGGDSAGPSLCWTGSEFGLAWSDARSGDYEVWFNRLSRAGVASGVDQRITSIAGATGYTTLAWAGSSYGLAWQEFTGGDWDVYFTRLSSTGAKLIGDVAVTTDAIGNELPALAWNGSDFGIVWNDARDGDSDVWFNRLDLAGTKLNLDANASANGTHSFDASLVWDGSEWAVTWTDLIAGLYEIDFIRLAQNGARVGTTLKVSSAAATSESSTIAWTGAEFGVAWDDYRAGSNDLYFARVSQAGALLAETVLTTNVGNEYLYPDRCLAFGTLGFGVVSAYDQTGAVRFLGIGCHADTTPPSCPTGLVVTANSAAGVTLAWAVPGNDAQSELAFHRIYRDGVPIGITTLPSYTDVPRPAGSPTYSVTAVNALGLESTGCALVSAPEPTGSCGEDWTGSQLVAAPAASYADGSDIAWTGSIYGVTWRDGRTGTSQVFFRAMAAAGVPLTTDVPVSANPAFQYLPSIAWDGTSFGIAWTDARNGPLEIYFNRVSPAGVVLGVDSRITTSYAELPSLAWTGSEYGVAYIANPGNLEIYFKRISPTGAPLGADVRVTNDPFESSRPSLVWNGTEYGVAWHDYRSSLTEIYFNRISESGVVQIAGDVRVTNDPDFSQGPSLSWNGSEYGVAWQDSRNGGWVDIFFKRISATGAPLGADQQVSAIDAAGSYSPNLVWTGAEYAVAWYDYRFLTGSAEIFYATLDASGIRIGAERRLTTSTSTDHSPSLAVGGRGLGLVYAIDTASQDQIRFMGLGCGPLDATPPSCPSAPVEASRSPGNPGTLTLAWGPSIEPESDFSHYRILRDGGDIGATATLSFTDAAFNPASGPTYWILGVNAAGASSGGCAAVDTADAVPPTCPTNLLAAVQAAPLQVTLTWLPATDARSGVRRYHLYRNNVLLASINAPGTTYTDATIAPGTTYNYAILAEDWAGNLSASCGGTSVVYISTSPITLFMTKDGDGIHADLDWNDAGLNEYVVYRSVSPQTASEHERVPVSATDDPVLQDGVTLWFYYIQQRGL